MSAFISIKNNYENVKSGIVQPVIFYSELWSRLAILSSDEKKTVMQFSEELSGIDFFSSSLHDCAKGMYCTFVADFSNGITFCLKAIEGFKQQKFNDGILASSTLLSICHKSIGQLDKAQQYMQMGLALLPAKNTESPFKYFHAVICYQAGELCVQFGSYETAIDHYRKGLQYVDKHIEISGRMLSGLGVTYMITGQWQKSIEHFEEALTAVLKTKNPLLESKIYSDIGTYYFKTNDHKKALENQLLALEIREKNNLLNPATTTYIQLAEIYLATGKSEEAIEFANKALVQAGKLKTLIKLFEAHEILSRIYEGIGNIEQAFFHYKQFQKYKDEVHNQEVMRKVEQLTSQHKIETSEKEKEIFRLRNTELKSALDEIKESFKYATRIQKAILPSDKNFKKHFPESFVMYNPKDIVAGDFYWLEEVNGEIFVAACDCTGHGVPGAMVSVVCHNALNRAVREFKKTESGTILEKTRDLIIEEFEKSEEDVKDGMDVVLCGIKNKVLQFAGANNPLWIINKGEFVEIKGNKQPVGKHITKEPFVNHTLQLEKNDIVYLFSDGFADQFGGPSGKKYRYSKLKELLISIKDLSMAGQKEILANNFETWKGDLEQVDDVLLIGIRII